MGSSGPEADDGRRPRGGLDHAGAGPPGRSVTTPRSPDRRGATATSGSSALFSGSDSGFESGTTGRRGSGSHPRWRSSRRRRRTRGPPRCPPSSMPTDGSLESRVGPTGSRSAPRLRPRPGSRTRTARPGPTPSVHTTTASPAASTARSSSPSTASGPDRSWGSDHVPPTGWVETCTVLAGRRLPSNQTIVAAPSASTATTGSPGKVTPSFWTSTAGTQVGAATAGSAASTPATIADGQGQRTAAHEARHRRTLSAGCHHGRRMPKPGS